MRLALFSDIHGNRFALDAVIADAQAFGVDSYLAVGDLAAVGSEPVARRRPAFLMPTTLLLIPPRQSWFSTIVACIRPGRFQAICSG